MLIPDDLLSIILRFRKYKSVVSAHIAKMYRRILTDKQQRNLQRILWILDSSQPIKTYKLNTLTYGNATASYLVTRCLRQLGEENKERYPTVNNVIINETEQELNKSNHVDFRTRWLLVAKMGGK